MHLLRSDQRSMDEACEPVDLEQSPADVVVLSFTQSDLGTLAQAAHTLVLPFSLRLASLADLKHPFSVDLYAEKVLSKARFILVRLLGGLDYWRYGVEELAALARKSGIALAFIPGDQRPDPRLDAASTLDGDSLMQMWQYFHNGGDDNAENLLRFIGSHLGCMSAPSLPAPVAAAGEWGAARRDGTLGQALVVFYRSAYLAQDVQPVTMLADALAGQGLAVTALYVSSLKDAGAMAVVRAMIQQCKPDIILNMTAFSAKLDDESSVLDSADCPVFQLIMSSSSQSQWQASSRGLSATDMAMTLVLPELDGRITGGIISFKEAGERQDAVEFSHLRHQSHESLVLPVAKKAAALVRLRKARNADKKLALIASDYPMKAGRAAYAVGLDTPQSMVEIIKALATEGYGVEEADASAIMRALSHDASQPFLKLADYKNMFAQHDAGFRQSVLDHWGAAESDPSLMGEGFSHRYIKAGRLIIALQPDRGHHGVRKDSYHDTAIPPCHGYIAFYLWLRQVEHIDAVIHLGTHGTTEWLPGKAVALSPSCAPQAIIGDVPVIYPFIVNNPGEASQAKRRIGALTIGHLTPPLIEAATHGPLAELEGYFDEYAQALDLDPNRAKTLATLILDRAEATGLLADAGIGKTDDVLAALDGWLCDIKEMRIGDGLHVFGRDMDSDTIVHQAQLFSDAAGLSQDIITEKLAVSPSREMQALLKALSGRFVAAGPAGAPSRGRLDVLPTGRNLTSVDPRAIPTRTAYEVGKRAAEAVITRHLQDHGDYPRAVVLDLWGSAQMRTGGDDLAQAFSLLGAKPVWDHGSNRVSGFEVLPLAILGRPRIDVTLRISGLFRDVFGAQITLFAQAVKAVAEQDEDEADNPLKAAVNQLRIFGQAQGYGTGIGGQLASGAWQHQSELAETYLAVSSFAFDHGEAMPAAAAFRAQVKAADAFIHVQDMAGQDVLDSDAYAHHQGGFAAAAAHLGATPALYHVDATAPERIKARTVSEEVARVLRGRATNPRWLAGQMRHGYRGASEIAETVQNLFNYAALTTSVKDHHFDALFDATLGDEAVHAFLAGANADALVAIARLFDEAQRRGLWQSRRNATRAQLSDMLGGQDGQPL